MTIEEQVARCPFLTNLARVQGIQYAVSVGVCPNSPAPQPRRPILEEQYSFGLNFQAYHNPETGVVPLFGRPKNLFVLPGGVTTPAASASTPELCPWMKQQRALQPEIKAQTVPSPPSSALRRLPLATLSLGFAGGLPDFGAFLNNIQRRVQNHQPSQPKPKPKPSSNNPSQQQNRGPGSARTGPPGSQPPSQSTALSSSSAHPLNPPTPCPLRKALGPLATIVMNQANHITCPEFIVQARAMLAATTPVRNLRPQALSTKLFAVGTTTAAVNLPLGAWREHFEKFSPGWVVAVHASIPFIAMLRKAVIMPKYAIIFTIAAAVAGQAIGARAERQRLAQLGLVGSDRPAKIAIGPAVTPALMTQHGVGHQHQQQWDASTDSMMMHGSESIAAVAAAVASVAAEMGMFVFQPAAPTSRGAGKAAKIRAPRRKVIATMVHTRPAETMPVCVAVSVC